MDRGRRALAERGRRERSGRRARDPPEVFVDRRRSRAKPFHDAYPGRHAGPVAWRDDRVRLRVLFDRSVLEIFGNDGETVITERVYPTHPFDRLELLSDGRRATRGVAVGARRRSGTDADSRAPTLSTAPLDRICTGDLEAPPGFEPGMEVLQTSALPLGDGADRNRIVRGVFRPRLRRRQQRVIRRVAGASSARRTRQRRCERSASRHDARSGAGGRAQSERARRGEGSRRF